MTTAERVAQIIEGPWGLGDMAGEVIDLLASEPASDVMGAIEPDLRKRLIRSGVKLATTDDTDFVDFGGGRVSADGMKAFVAWADEHGELPTDK